MIKAGRQWDDAAHRIVFGTRHRLLATVPVPQDNSLRIEEFKQVNFRELIENKNKLVHTFGALAELGHEVARRTNFQDTIRTSLHLVLGSLGIMRGGVARYARFEHELNLLAMRGLGDAFPLSLELCHEDERQFLANGLHPIEISQASVLPFFQVYDRTFSGTSLELFVPLVISALLSVVLGVAPDLGVHAWDLATAAATRVTGGTLP